jgi:hypothetical protein
VIDVVLLVDALARFGIADALELGLRRNVFLHGAAGGSALARGGLCAVDDVAVVVFARAFGAGLFHVGLLRPEERTMPGPVPAPETG